VRIFERTNEGRQRIRIKDNLYVIYYKIEIKEKGRKREQMRGKNMKIWNKNEKN
jgi:hypothetical protein